MALSIVIVDSEEISRKGLVALLRDNPEIAIVGEAGDFAYALEVSRARQPDALILRTLTLTEDNVAGISMLKSEMPDLGMLVLASKADQAEVIGAVKAGARGFMTTGVDTQTLVSAIRNVSRGEVVLSRQAMLEVVDFLSLPESRAVAPFIDGMRNGKPRLTTRETEVLCLVSEGSSNRQIAEQLVISEHTVRAHLRNILDKLGFENRIQAATWAARLGLERTPPQGAQAVGLAP